jgi:glutamine amidotransferase
MIAIVKYNAGNIHSVINALHRIGVEPILTDSADELRSADKVIFPGVGEARSAMTYLREHGLDAVIRGLTQPVLGVCVGMQLLCSYSEENNTDCIGVFPVHVRKFVRPSESSTSTQAAMHKIPHIGWNSIEQMRSPLFDGLADNSFVYYVHSYHAELSPFTIAQTTYIQPFSAALHHKNFYGVQFHPEKSGTLGERIYRNFMAL